jgi:hypothetical protein
MHEFRGYSMKQVRALTPFSFVFLIAAWPLTAAGAPSISSVEGELAQGNQVTISGSNFGIKSPAKPYLWVPFEGSADPSPLGVVRNWTVEEMVYTPNEGAGGSGGLKAANNTGKWAASVTASGFNWNDPGQKMYIFRKSKRNFDIWNNPPGITSDDGPEINYKSWRLWSEGFTTPNALIGISNGTAVAASPEVESGDNLWPFTDHKAAAGKVGEWHTNEISIRSNTNAVGKGDGFFQYVTNGTVYGEVPYDKGAGTRYWKMWDAASPPSMVMNFVVHEVRANATFPSDWRAWADDVYLDTTWARVMIGDAPNFADAKHREIQIPSAWSSSSVTVTVQTGTFPADATPYLFVIDADGNASQGYAVGVIRPRSPEALKAE